jgi:hypothetical protein
MTVSLSRLLRAELALAKSGHGETQEMHFIAPNAWPDAERSAWNQAAPGATLPRAPSDFITKTAMTHERQMLIARVHGLEPDQVGMVIEIPAPEEIEAADEPTRAAWYGEFLLRNRAWPGNAAA